MPAMNRVVPCFLERRVVSKVWGGRELSRVLGLDLPGEEPVGETWEAFDRPDGSSPVRDADGVTLGDLVRADARAWLGAKFAGADRFPLILKYIDARTALSVQLHPDENRASAGGERKHEAWVVLDAGADARIVRGLRDGVERDEFEAAVGTEAIEPMLYGFRPEVGDAVFVPAGTVHALGPDVVVFEVQENSDTTYRVYDWGRPRELHLEESRRAYREIDDVQTTTIPPEPCSDGGRWLVRHDSFSVRRFQPDQPMALLSEGSFKLLSVVAGQGTIGWRSGGDDPPLLARTGDTVLVPGSMEQVFLSPVGRFDFLWTSGDRGGES